MGVHDLFAECADAVSGSTNGGVRRARKGRLFRGPEPAGDAGARRAGQQERGDCDRERCTCRASARHSSDSRRTCSASARRSSASSGCPARWLDGQCRKECRQAARDGNEDATKLQGNDNEEASNRQRTGKQTSAETSPAAAKRAERLGFARLQTLGRLFLVLKLLELYISAIIWCAQKRRTCENGQNRVILIADRSSQPVCM